MLSTLPVVETFHSIQGEGAHAGRSAFFIRLASCNVGCKWCDTKESWNPNNHSQISINVLARYATQATSKGASFIVLTGGEPLHHNLTPLCTAIKTTASKAGIQSMPIHLETSGVDELSCTPNWLTLSPKRHAPPKLEILETCQELKVIIHAKEDLYFAEEMAKEAITSRRKSKNNQESTSKKPLLFLQPGWNSVEGAELAFQHVLKNPNWRLSMQTHKWLGVH